MNIHDRVGTFFKEYWVALVVTASCIGFSLWLQLDYEWSAMQLDEDTWKQMLNLHLTWAPFAVRYFQNYSTLTLNYLFGWPIRESFFIVQYGLAFVLGLVMYRYYQRLGFHRGWSLVGLALTFTAYPVMGAHFEPTHTWDDFWSYLFLAAALLAALNHHPIRSGIYLTLGCLAREQIILFYPAWVVLLWTQRVSNERMRLLITLAITPLVLAVFRAITWQPLDPSRWRLYSYNFTDIGHTNDTLVSTVIAFGALWLLSIAGLWFVSRLDDQSSRRLLIGGMVTAVPMTTAVTLLFSFARETRIFFPSFVIVAPLSLLALHSFWQYTVRQRIKWLWLAIIPLSAPAIYFGLKLAHRTLAKFDYGSNAMFRRDVAGVHFGLAMICVAAVLLAGAIQLTRKILLRR